MKRKDFLDEIKKLSDDELSDREKSLTEEKMKLRFRKASGQLEEMHRVKEVRLSLARVKTERSARRAAAASESSAA